MNKDRGSAFLAKSNGDTIGKGLSNSQGDATWQADFLVTSNSGAMGDDASGSVDASHSLDLILNQPVFNFSAPGVTANGDFIVDNIFVGPGLKRGRSQLTSQ